MRAAHREVARLTRRTRRDRLFLVILCIVSLGLVAGGVTLSIIVGDLDSQNAALQRQAAATQRQAIVNCQAGNLFRAQNTRVWTDFIDLVLQGNKNPRSAAEGASFIRYVQHEDILRKC
jgi:ABC-type lipoprotein release transport system permease subunit